MKLEQLRSLYNVGDVWHFCGSDPGVWRITSVGTSAIVVEDEHGEHTIVSFKEIARDMRELGVEVEG